MLWTTTQSSVARPSPLPHTRFRRLVVLECGFVPLAVESGDPVMALSISLLSQPLAKPGGGLLTQRSLKDAEPMFVEIALALLEARALGDRPTKERWI